MLPLSRTQIRAAVLSTGRGAKSKLCVNRVFENGKFVADFGKNSVPNKDWEIRDETFDKGTIRRDGHGGSRAPLTWSAGDVE